MAGGIATISALKKFVNAIPKGEKQSRILADNGIVHPMLRSPRRPGGLHVMTDLVVLHLSVLNQLIRNGFQRVKFVQVCRFNPLPKDIPHHPNTTSLLVSFEN